MNFRYTLVNDECYNLDNNRQFVVFNIDRSEHPEYDIVAIRDAVTKDLNAEFQGVEGKDWDFLGWAVAVYNWQFIGAIIMACYEDPFDQAAMIQKAHAIYYYKNKS